ncbi:MAG: hypothetical protein DRQ88_05160 [Epsilonproteobacteria bacterium]|nr:MAG: hypothetical protein DRQ89_04595 [Campylobacterota bacterium]RLA66817.1 MAG: hypothetical protein DRQ88_05160 [Campylobacterota bacterium]
MPLPFIHSYETEMTKTNLKVPVINGIHLHSIYDPERESRDLLKENLGMISTKKTILVFGLGFAYHLKELVNYLKNHWGKDFLIAVVEPLDQTVSECDKLGLLPPENVLIFSGMEIKELYANTSFTNFLLKRPGILPHPSSLSFFNDYFKELMSQRATKDLGSIIELVNSPEIKKYLSDFSPSSSLDHFLKTDLIEKPILNDPNDFLFHALKELNLERV